MKIRLFLLIAVVALVTSCKSVEYVIVPEVHTDTLIISKHQRDSIWLHDSIYMKEYMRGDTVYLLRDRWHTQYVEKQVHDTTYISITDTVPLPYPVEVEVERQLTWWQRFRLYIGNIMLVMIGFAILYAATKLYKKFHL